MLFNPNLFLVRSHVELGLMDATIIKFPVHENIGGISYFLLTESVYYIFLEISSCCVYIFTIYIIIVY